MKYFKVKPEYLNIETLSKYGFEEEDECFIKKLNPEYTIFIDKQNGTVLMEYNIKKVSMNVDKIKDNISLELLQDGIVKQFDTSLK